MASAKIAQLEVDRNLVPRLFSTSVFEEHVKVSSGLLLESLSKLLDVTCAVVPEADQDKQH